MEKGVGKEKGVGEGRERMGNGQGIEKAKRKE